MHKTTIVLSLQLLKAAKLFALQRDRTLKDVIEEALERYLMRPQLSEKRSDAGLFEIAPPVKSKITGNLKRSSLYTDRIARQG
ncbi:MAG: hypothetical protein AABZ44_01125 [Elusimicrobiota bacterium]